jgi:UTP--glucose-1-phosphate uridylyltransferase
VSRLESRLLELPPDVAAALGRFGFDRTRFLAHAERLGKKSDNRVSGRVTPPTSEDIPPLPAQGSDEWERCSTLGRGALERGEVALCVLAGGMATRMGGVVKALVDAIPGRTFLDLRLAEIDHFARRFGKPAPLWLMSSYATDDDLKAALGARLDGERIATFSQGISLRLTPDADLFLEDDGRPSVHAPGHGDLPDALRSSGLLGRFVERGGKVVMVTNIDNLGATLDPVIVGWHFAHGDPVSMEVVDKQGTDRGGIPVRLDDRRVVLEEFRLPDGFDPTSVPVFNTNTFHFDARALNDLDMTWTYFLVEKRVDNRPAIQFERLIGEVTSVLPTRFLRLPRTGAESRFLPVKDNQELTARQGEIELVARTRGFL